MNRDGAFADYVVIPASNVWVHPGDLDPDLGAIFDPFGNATHTALSFPIAGEDVVITGAGPIGVMATAITRHVGARFIVVTDISDVQRSWLRGGADSFCSAQRRRHYGTRWRPAWRPDIVHRSPARHPRSGRAAMMMTAEADPMPDARRLYRRLGPMITHCSYIKGIYGREMFDTSAP
ncbi:MAG: hypothetical protein R2734_07475 [Nocardioides sp.]